MFDDYIGRSECIKGTGKSQPVTWHKDTEGVRGIATLSLTSELNKDGGWVVNTTIRERDPVPILQEAGCVSETGLNECG